MTRRRTFVLILLLALVLLSAMVLPKGKIRRLPLDVVPNAGVSRPMLSDKGRWLVFQSRATNFVEDADGSDDIYRVDTKKGKIKQISRTRSGGDPVLGCVEPVVSPTGRYVAYQSGDSEIVADDPSFTADIFVFDTKKGKTERASVNDAGEGGAGHSGQPAVSENGRWVAFSSFAGNLVTGDFNGKRDVFLRDRKLDTTVRVSLRSNGDATDADSENPAISNSGRFVAFMSEDDLVPEDTNGRDDVYVRDMKKGKLILVSVGHEGQIGDGDSGAVLDISSSGRYVSFTSGAQNLVPGDVAFISVFRRDLEKERTIVVSEAKDGTPASSVSTDHALSPDGKFVAFRSSANNLGPPDANVVDDIYLKDLKKGSVKRISLAFGGETETDDTSSRPTLSKSGKFVAFQSLASNLLKGGDGTPAQSDVYIIMR